MTSIERPPTTRTRNPRARETKPTPAREDQEKENTMSQTTFSFVGTDADMWLDTAACAGLPIESFFVQAGHVIDEEVLNVCRGCPVRIDCLRHSYNESLNITGGYFGGMSPGQRREMTFEQARTFCATDLVSESSAGVAATEEDPVVYS